MFGPEDHCHDLKISIFAHGYFLECPALPPNSLHFLGQHKDWPRNLHGRRGAHETPPPHPEGLGPCRGTTRRALDPRAAT
ncbi:hypothetical protein BDV95DRAFT_578069 [Massariosphaeria phaeospora]|uniref:Uncharacterized protein n=1 Tax=Massariosphaeria phaeospora TaxID=100035 RepID=A0A7C8I299_9PLEO|nr:hypothetical protein BDV95DRAFT_578069 [Massariosphaeria phaeospora]